MATQSDDPRTTTNGKTPAPLPSSPKAKFEFLTAQEVMQLPAYEFYGDGLIQAQGVTVLFGEPKIGKTFLMLLLASEIAQGMPVLYAAAQGLPGYGPRLVALDTRYKRPLDNLRFTRTVNVYAAEEVIAFIEAARPGEYNVMVFDTLAACMGEGDETLPRDMQRVMSNCRRIVDALGYAVVLVHHPTKSGETYRGANPLYGDADMMMVLREDGDGLLLTCIGARNREDFAPQRYRLEPEGTSLVAVRAVDGVTVDQELPAMQRTILEALASEPFRTAGAKWTQLQKRMGLSNNALDSELKDLSQKGLIRHAAKGTPYFIEDAGLQALSPLSKHSHESPESAPSSPSATLSPLSSKEERGERVPGASPDRSAESATSPVEATAGSQTRKTKSPLNGAAVAPETDASKQRQLDLFAFAESLGAVVTARALEGK